MERMDLSLETIFADGGGTVHKLRHVDASRIANKTMNKIQFWIADWVERAFGTNRNMHERAMRLGEETNEAMQACSVSREEAHRLVDRVYDRPVGEIGQELGGVMVTVLGLAEACNISAYQALMDEVNRINDKNNDSYWQARHAEKVALGISAPNPNVKPTLMPAPYVAAGSAPAAAAAPAMTLGEALTIGALARQLTVSASLDGERYKRLHKALDEANHVLDEWRSGDKIQEDEQLRDED